MLRGTSTTDTAAQESFECAAAFLKRHLPLLQLWLGVPLRWPRDEEPGILLEYRSASGSPTVAGPSVGTVAFLSMVRALSDGNPRLWLGRIASTGTVTASGHVGEVGGVPIKVRAAVEYPGVSRCLVPAGGYAQLANTGFLQSVQREAQQQGRTPTAVVPISDVVDLLHQSLDGQYLFSYLSSLAHRPTRRRTV